MGLTGFSFCLIPLCLGFITAPDKLLKVMLIAAVFEAAAALTIGAFGVQPGLLPALCFIGYVLLQMLLGAKYRALDIILRLAAPFIAVAVWALAASYVMPRIFDGEVSVWPQKQVFPFVAVLVNPSSTNLNQDIYLAVNVVFALLAATYLASRSLPLHGFVRCYFYSGLVATAVSLWQFASRVAGVPYPESFFYSNPGWALLMGQTIGAIPRINGPFSEPAALANYMSSLVCAAGWMLLRGHRDWLTLVAFVTGLFAIAISTSTTGFAVLAISAVGVPVVALVTGSARLLSALVRVGLPALVACGLLFATVTVFAPGLIASAAAVVDATMQKGDSSSFEDRTTADLDSLATVADTYGLGVGWGSNRSSSLLPGLLANTGVPGVAGLIWFAFSLGQRVRRTARYRTADEGVVTDAACGGMFGYLLGAVISAPTITSLTFYFLLALLLTTTARPMLRLERAANVERRAFARAHPGFL